MIDEKKIDEKAHQHMLNEYYVADTNDWGFPCDTPDIKSQCENDFKAGALWAQQEFRKTLWYSTKIEPERGKDIIAISQKGEAYTFCYHALSAIQKSFHDCNIERWCYLSDILPKEGGEE